MDVSDFTYVGHRTEVERTSEGWLAKSRGTLKIDVRRRSMPFIQSLLVPELLVLVISLTIFWLPPQAAFVMPRVATALISFLTFTMLGLRTNSMLPIRGGLVWIDLFETSCQAIMFFALLLNIFVLVVFHTFKDEELAVQLDRELMLAFPLLAIVAFILIFLCAQKKNLAFLSISMNVFLLGGGIAYTGFAIWRRRRRRRRQQPPRSEMRPSFLLRRAPLAAGSWRA